MAGHSQFKNIMHRKGRQDADRARMFARLSREISIAARQGNDPEMNARLRVAIANARSANMPKDNIERARLQHDDKNRVSEEIRYEGFGPGNVPILIDAWTDNRNRTVSDIRFIFNKSGGRLAERNSVAFMFMHQGIVTYASLKDENEFLTVALNAGADDVEIQDDHAIIYCAPDKFYDVRDAAENALGIAENAQVCWICHTPVHVDDAEAFQNFLQRLENHDDVQNVWHGGV